MTRRFHTGGVVGLKPNEVPAILSNSRSCVALGVEQMKLYSGQVSRKGRDMLEDVHIVITCDTSDIQAAVRRSAEAFRDVWLFIEMRRMERRVRDLYERFL